MTPPVLPIFPEGSLADSVVVTVWLGVFVVAFFNLRLGWTFSGLVVPGYLIPLFIAKPLSATVVLCEGILTYFLVWFFSSHLSRYGGWSNFFGRDRFFALVVCSVIVRVVCDGFLLPFLGELLTTSFNIEFDTVNNLHSFGLIIVSLIANQFWKPGFRAGLRPLLVTLALTYVLVRFPLMWFTNFNIGNLEYMYEDVSSSVLASPKAYIVLLVTSFLASRMNLLYAWDYNGILIPSLLALQWYEPLKIVTSLVEAWAIYLLACMALRLPWLREATVEGARKVVLFFNLSLIYKLCLSHILTRLNPELYVSDWYGFGYLLPTLLAIKMHDKGIALRITRTTLQTSAAGALAATAVGFSLTYVPQDWLWSLGTPRTASALSRDEVTPDLLARLRQDKFAIYEHRLKKSFARPSHPQLETFTAGLRSLRSYLADGDPVLLQTARLQLARVSYSVRTLEDGILYLHESAPLRGWGIYCLDPKVPRGMLVQVPSPLEEWATLEAGAHLFQLSAALARSTELEMPSRPISCRALAISTWDKKRRSRDPPVVLTSHGTFFQRFHRIFGGRDVLQVRGYSPSTLRELVGSPGLSDTDVPSSLWVSGTLPPGLSLRLLKDILPQFKLNWQRTPFRNLQRDTTLSGFSELFLNRRDRKRMLARFLLGTHIYASDPRTPEVEGNLLNEVLSWKDDIAPRGSNLYDPPKPDNMLFMDEEVVKPLVRLALNHREETLDPESLATEIQAIHAAASALDYGVTRLHDVEAGEHFLVLREKVGSTDRRYWGTYVVRLGSARPYAVAIPRPLYERDTLAFGVSLFQKLRAPWLLVAGAHPKCNTDDSADVVKASNKLSFFNLVNQVLLREAGTEQLLVLQVRAFGHRHGQASIPADALLALSDGITAGDSRPVLTDLRSALEADQLQVRIVDGSDSTAGYEVYDIAQYQYLNHTENKLFAALWVSPFARANYRQTGERATQNFQFEALELETREGSLHKRLSEDSFLFGSDVPQWELVGLLEHYRATQDVNALHVIGRRWPDLRLVRLIDRGTDRPFLLIYQDDQLVPVVANLSFQPEGGDQLKLKTPVDKKDVKRFAGSTASLLFIEDAP